MLGHRLKAFWRDGEALPSILFCLLRFLFTVKWHLKKIAFELGNSSSGTPITITKYWSWILVPAARGSTMDDTQGAAWMRKQYWDFFTSCSIPCVLCLPLFLFFLSFKTITIAKMPRRQPSSAVVCALEPSSFPSTYPDPNFPSICSVIWM